MENSNVTFGYDVDKIKEKMAVRGLTMQRVGQLAGVHPSTVASVLRRRTAKPPTVKKIAEAIGLTLEEIIVRSEEAVA